MISRVEREIFVLAHDIRSAHNIGALFRLCDGLNVATLYLTGYTPHPIRPEDPRLPHIRQKLQKQIEKTALGAQSTLAWEFHEDPAPLIKRLRSEGTVLAGLEQADDSVELAGFSPPKRLCLVLGREVEGIDPDLLARCDVTLEIPMLGKKESHNVVNAAAMALFHCRFH
ncbi:MAG: TrmH family RNA methyltransferase [Candidatus Saccharibacteria bacterium]|nr:TrmH family RNA methyltransferase [Candidatus Saccharibacteria bacterium]